MNKNKIIISLVVLLIGVLFLLLRENEGKVQAQTQLKNIQFKATSMINEKGDAINDLETQLAEQQANLVECQESCEKALMAKNEEIGKISADAELKAEQQQQEIAQKNKANSDLETQMKNDADRFDKALKKKNSDLSEMGEELRKTTERLAKALKKQESIESENYNLQNQLAGVERQLQALKNEKTRLEDQLKAAQDKPAVLD